MAFWGGIVPQHVCGPVQELGPKYARNVKVSMDEMRRKQFAAAKIVMRQQHQFLREGTIPRRSAADFKLAPTGEEGAHMDEEGEQVRYKLLLMTSPLRWNGVSVFRS